MSRLLKVSNKACALYGASLAKYVGHDLILCYHSVRDKQRPLRGWLGASRSLDSLTFAAQMRWLSDAAHVVSLSDMLDTPRTGNSIRVAVTFDDGYFDNIDVAMPILRQYDIPLTWFVATDFIDNETLLPWWDLIDLALEKCSAPIELNADEVRGSYDPNVDVDRQWLNTKLRMILKSSDTQKRDAITEDIRQAISQQLDLPVNSYAREEEIKSALLAGGLELGGHTASHPNVALCGSDVLTAEITRGKSRLEAISEETLRWFAYPFGGNGAFSLTAANAVRDAGFEGACTLLSGTLRAKTKRYMVPRFAVSPTMTLDTFKARVLGAPLYAGLERLRSTMSDSRRYGRGFLP